MTKIKEKNPIQRKIHKAFHEIAKKRKVNVDKVSEIIDDWEKIMRKKKKPIKLNLKELIIPDNYLVIPFTDKKEFLAWCGMAWVYVSKKTNDDGNYFFCCFSSDNVVATYKQKKEKL